MRWWGKQLPTTSASLAVRGEPDRGLPAESGPPEATGPARVSDEERAVRLADTGAYRLYPMWGFHMPVALPDKMLPGVSGPVIRITFTTARPWFRNYAFFKDLPSLDCPSDLPW